MSHFPTVHPPEEMTRSARVYLFAGAGRNLMVGLFAWRWPEQFTSGVYVPIIEFAGIGPWAVSLLATGLVLFAGAMLRHRDIARVGLVMSVAATAFMAAGIWIGAADVWLAGGTAAPISAPLLTALVVKDSAVCGNPMRLPLDLTGWIKARAT